MRLTCNRMGGFFQKVRVINLTQGGLKAMETKLERERGNPAYVSADGTAKGGVETVDGKKGKQGRIASNEMCTFLILNISSLQLIPVNMIAYRQQYGSVNPAAIVAANTICVKKSALIRIVWYNV